MSTRYLRKINRLTGPGPLRDGWQQFARQS
jgi:hypothetical protein